MRVTIYGKVSCSYCMKAKALAGLHFDQGEVNYIDMDEHGLDKAALQRICGSAVTTIPQIFLDGKHIGGYGELLEVVSEAKS